MKPLLTSGIDHFFARPNEEKASRVFWLVQNLAMLESIWNNKKRDLWRLSVA